MTTPKCTIFKDWSGPECGDPAITMNEYGGFQCEFHSSIAKCKNNDAGPHTPIERGQDTELQAAYDKHIAEPKEPSAKFGSKIIIAAHNVPQNMKRSSKKDAT